MKTIDSQIAHMSLNLPSWALKRIDERTAVWNGVLQPFQTSYQIRVEHWVPPVLEKHSILYVQPLIEVLDPPLVRQPGNKEGELPHVYWGHPRTERPGPFLCVFDAEAREWTSSDYLAETTVPFALNWLSGYEGWVATGKWLTLGRHAGEKRIGEGEYKN